MTVEIQFEYSFPDANASGITATYADVIVDYSQVLDPDTFPHYATTGIIQFTLNGQTYTNSNPIVTLGPDTGSGPTGKQYDLFGNMYIDGKAVGINYQFGEQAPTQINFEEAYNYVASGQNQPDNTNSVYELETVPVTSTSVPCYCPSTLIRTAHGDVAVEALAIGDLVVTASGAERPIKWVGRRTVDCRDVPQPEAVRPVCICAGAIAPGMPRRDLFVSPDHAIFFDDILVPAKSLINGSTVQQVRTGVVTYYGLELDTHDMVIAEGLAAESYLDDGLRNRFDNYSGDGSDLDPSKAIAREGSYRPLVINGARVAQVRSWVDARAERLGQPAIYGLSKADLAEDADPDRAGAADEIIVGCLERISREEISGWVWTEGLPNEPVVIEIDLDGVTVAALRSDEYRPDLHFAKIGVGRHGFRLRLPPASYQQRWMNVGVRVRSSGMHLTNSPAIIATETNETIVLV